MKHIIIAGACLLSLHAITYTGDESPSSFTSPKDSRKKDRMAAQHDKLSSSDKERIKGGERQRLKQQANHLAKKADLIKKDVVPELE